jgi:hypothetical protein
MGFATTLAITGMKRGIRFATDPRGTLKVIIGTAFTARGMSTVPSHFAGLNRIRLIVRRECKAGRMILSIARLAFKMATR